MIVQASIDTIVPITITLKVAMVDVGFSKLKTTTKTTATAITCSINNICFLVSYISFVIFLIIPNNNLITIKASVSLSYVH